VVDLNKLDAWVYLNLDPDLFSELDREEIEKERYSSPEAFVNNMPQSLKVDRQGRYYVKVPNELISAIKSLATLTTEPLLRAITKATTYMAHYGFVKILTETRWKEAYRLSRAMAIGMPAIRELFGNEGLDLLFSPVIEHEGQTRRISLFPLFYDIESRTMNNVDTMTAVFGQLLPRDFIVTWALARAVKDSLTAERYGLWKIGDEFEAKMRAKAIETLKKKTALLKIMASHPEFDDHLPAESIEKFRAYMGGL